MIIKSVSARKIKDSRSDFTIEVSVNGQKASSPSGKSTGKYETPSYNNSLDWNIKAINNFNELKNISINNFSDLSKVESLIKRKFKLFDAKQFGANALFALESAVLKALAKSKNKHLWQVINPKAKKFPIPIGNAVGGGTHSKNKDHPVFQEFLLIPNKISPEANVRILNSNYKKIKSLINSNVKNDEGAWQTSLNNEQVLSILSLLKEVKFGLDIASSTFYRNGNYSYKNKKLSRFAQIDYINNLIEKYKIFYIEDPLEEKDFAGFSRILTNTNLRAKVLICGDDLTATHMERLQKAIKEKSINSMIIKPNQNGSLLELAEIFKFCKKNKIKTILSHRSGETLDSALADYSFGFQADFIKCGISTKWREVKLKRLVEIEKMLQ